MSRLDDAYEQSESLNKVHGKTYYAATKLLPRESRREVHALYGLFRYVDDIIDNSAATTAQKLKDLDDAERDFFSALSGQSPKVTLFFAPADTARRNAIDMHFFQAFFASMRMDLTKSSYQTFADLEKYMDGSAAVIGEALLGTLRATSTQAHQPARDLGFAFQLTNFLRDVGEDLARNRVYIPQDDLLRFDADVNLRTVNNQWRALMQFEIARARDLYRDAEQGIALLPLRSGACVKAALLMYERILQHIETNDYDVFSRRATVPSWEKVSITLRVALEFAAKGLRSVLSARLRNCRETIGTKNPYGSREYK